MTKEIIKHGGKLNLKVHHIGMIVYDPKPLVDLFFVMGWRTSGQSYNDPYGVRTHFITNGEIHIEFFVPENNKKFRRLLVRNGNHIHHLGFEVEDIISAMNRLEDKGYRIIGDGPVPGFGGRQAVFVDPLDSKGILIELMGD